MRAELVERRSSFARAAPRQRAVHQRLGEYHGRAGRAGQVVDAWVGVLQVPPFVREPKVALVAAGDHAGTAVARIHVGEVVRDDGEAVVHAALTIVVVLGGVEVTARPVQRGPDRPFALATDVEEEMVKAERRAENRLEAGAQTRIVDERAVGFAPIEKTAEAVRTVVRRCLGDAFVERCVQGGQLVGG